MTSDYRWWSRRLTVILVALVVASCARGQMPPRAPGAHRESMPAECGHGGKWCRGDFTLPGGWKIPVYSNVALSGSAGVTHAVIVIHGIQRNARTYFADMLAAATRDGVQEHTLVVAPWFQTAQDKPAPQAPYWVDQPPRRADAPGWMQGDDAIRPAGLSSFAVIDALVATLTDTRRFPNLRSVTVAGHSAGGQFVQRYAVFGTAANSLPRVGINYVVANPSSYLYFGPDRPTADGSRFVVPIPAACPNYDTYKYGFAHRPGYTSRISVSRALAQYLSRRVTIVNGGADTFDNGDEDTTCAAMAQGGNREIRGAYYAAYINARHPAVAHDRIVVPGAGHDNDVIFSSPLVAPALFGVDHQTR